MGVLVRFTRRIVTDKLLRQWWSAYAISVEAKTQEWLLAEQEGRLRCYAAQAERRGVDQGLYALAVYVVSGREARQDVGWVSTKAPWSVEEVGGWCVAQLRAEGIETVRCGDETVSTEPRMQETGLPVRARGRSTTGF
jgi:hypothetical protein